MCGIAGFVNCGDPMALQKMADCMSHRGPDDHGFQWFEHSCSGLAHRRLSIIDLTAGGHQPMCNDKGTLWITHNGEIYNYQEIRKQLIDKGCQFKSKSDTEVVLKAYEVWGEGCLARFNGMFAFAIYDSEKNELFAARDRIGVKPFYYHREGEQFIFASEIKAILASGLVEKSPDLFSLHTPTRFQISPYTGFKNILKLLPGHFLRFKQGNLEIKRYWDLAPSEDHVLSEDEATERLNGLLEDSVRLQMIADVPVGVFLSGGLDSSIISALMRKNSTGEIHSFTIRFSQADQKFEKMVDDSVYAQQVAGQLGFRYHEFEINPDICELLPKLVWHLDEPMADPAAINTYLISKAAREMDIVVLLNGMGGDEIFGGYRKHLACMKADAYQAIVPTLVRQGIERIFAGIPVATSSGGLRFLRQAKRFLSYASMPQAERYLMADLSLSEDQYMRFFQNGTPYRETHFFRSQRDLFDLPRLSYLTKMCLNDTRVLLPEHNLLYSDKASMAVGVEGRPPLTDHRIVEYMFSLPPEFRIHGNSQKYLLKKVSERYLPGKIVHRPKASFGSPLRSWIRGPLSPMINDLLSEESINSRGLYNPAFVSKLITNDRAGLEDNAHIIWTLLTNEVWFRTFFRN